MIQFSQSDINTNCEKSEPYKWFALFSISHVIIQNNILKVY